MEVKASKLAQPVLLRLIETDKDKINALTSPLWEKKKEELEIKGFRKGKVPQQLAEKHFGFDKLYPEVIDSLIRQGLPVGEQQFGKSIIEVQQVVPEIVSSEGIVLQVICYLKPSASVDYQNIVCEKKVGQVTEAMVDIAIEKLREQQVLEIPVEDRGIQIGDVITISFCGSINQVPFKGGTANDFHVEFKENTFIPDMTNALLGMTVGEKKTCDVVFPDDYQAPHLAGKKTEFELEVSDISQKSFPEVDDDFAQALGCQTVSELREQQKEVLQNQQEELWKSQLEQQIVQQLLTRAEIDPIPQNTITRQLDELLKQQVAKHKLQTVEEFLEKAQTTREKFDQTYYHSVARDMKIQLILDYIAEQEHVEVSEEDFEEYINEEAVKYQMQPEELKKRVPFQIAKSKIMTKKAYKILLDNVSYVVAEKKEKQFVGAGAELETSVIS